MDFGEYKGQMLGTLPSTYLRRISKNLRACNFEEWSRLADEVLEDPVYKDKIEWEFAEGVLKGNRAATLSKNMVELEEAYNPFPGRKGLLNKVCSLKDRKRPLCL
ncbi:hypothetical protein CDL15_Pgr028558 [Punica granatum]|nr:hypothetical protein CDL15_Pgr028558 [Punica granatum]